MLLLNSTEILIDVSHLIALGQLYAVESVILIDVSHLIALGQLYAVESVLSVILSGRKDYSIFNESFVTFSATLSYRYLRLS